MNNIEKIKAEIERLKIDYLNRSYTFVPATMQQLLEFIDSLPEEKQPEDLEEAAEKYSDKYCSDWAYRLEYEAAFIDGGKWQKEQMMKEAMVSEIGITSGGILLRDLRIEDFDYEDKAKIIIIKDND